MAATKEQLSPEEKLLRVIQGKDEPGDESDAGVAVAGPGVPAGTEQVRPPEPEQEQVMASNQEKPGSAGEGAAGALPVTGPEEKPKLKLAEQESERPSEDQALGSGGVADSSETPVPPETVEAGALPSQVGESQGSLDDMVGAVPAASRKKPREQTSGLRTANTCLTLIVLAMIIFTGLEIWANIQTTGQGPVPVQADGLGDIEAQEPGPERVESPGLYTLPELLVHFANRPILGPPAQNQSQNEPETRTVVVPVQLQWQTQVRESLRLIGLSRVAAEAEDPYMEAIVKDSKQNKLHMLRIGASLVISEQELTLEHIAGDHIVLTDGTEKLKVQ